MANIQQLLDDIKLRYRHTFTPAQVIVWMNEEQRELFDIFEIDANPYTFPTVVNTFFYAIPDGMEINKIKTATIQINNNTSPDFIELPWKPNDDRQYVDETTYWYSIVNNTWYINVPGGSVNDRAVYFYFDGLAVDISSSNLSIEPSTPVKYQEMLKIGTLKRIAAARKDTLMRNNYDADYQEKMAEMEWKMKMSTPEFQTPIDTMPRTQGRMYARRCP